MRLSGIAMFTFAFATVALGISTARADKMTCSSDGDFVRCALPNANQRHVNLVKQKGHHRCEKGRSWGADSDGIWVDDGCSAKFHYKGDKGHHEDYQKSHSRSRGGDDCPSGLGGNECAYYQDGYHAGKQDGRNSMSMAYERHSDAYDSRFEQYFAQGYRSGWNDYR